MVPVISVVIPTARGGSLLGQAVASVLGQSFGDLEVIVVANRPGLNLDDLPADRRIRLDVETVVGKAIAVNRGARVAKGRYLAFLDDDDVWETSKLERQLDSLARWAGVAACTTGYRLIDASGCIVSTGGSSRALDYDSLLKGSFTFKWSSLLLERELFYVIGNLDTSYRYADDFDFFLKLARLGRVAFVDDTLVRYRDHPAMSSRTPSWRNRQEALRALSTQRRLASQERDWRAVALSCRGAVSVRRHYALLEVEAAKSFEQSDGVLRRLSRLALAGFSYPPSLMGARRAIFPTVD